MIKCSECDYLKDVNTKAEHRPILQCRANPPTTDNYGFAQWPQIRDKELGCAEGADGTAHQDE